MAATRSVITFVAVAFQRYEMIPVLIHCLKAQTDGRWRLLIIHDGPDEEHRAACAQAIAGDARISYMQTAARAGHFGHPLRDLGLAKVRAPWVVLTNDDNYYAPVFVARMLRAAERQPMPLVVACNMVHNHPRVGYLGQEGKESSYGVLVVQPRRQWIDVGSFMARTEVAQQVGFKGLGHDSDGDYLEALVKAGGPGSFAKLEDVLFVHN